MKTIPVMNKSGMFVVLGSRKRKSYSKKSKKSTSTTSLIAIKKGDDGKNKIETAYVPVGQYEKKVAQMRLKLSRSKLPSVLYSVSSRGRKRIGVFNKDTGLFGPAF